MNIWMWFLSLSLSLFSFWMSNVHLIKIAICHLILAYNSSSRVWQGLIEDNRNWKWTPRVKLVIVPWRKSKPKFSKETSSCNGLLMAECVKWELSTVPTKSTSTNSSKWEGISCILHIAKCKPSDSEFRSYKHWGLLYCFLAFVMKCSLIFTH